jgi:hypothetical protein
MHALKLKKTEDCFICDVNVNIEVLGFHSIQGLGVFLFFSAPRPALQPIKPPIQWVPGAFSLGVKRPGREATSHLILVPRLIICATVPLLQYVFLGWCLVKHRDKLQRFMVYNVRASGSAIRVTYLKV